MKYTYNINAADQCQNTNNNRMQNGRMRKHMKYLLETTYRYASPVDLSGKFESTVVSDRGIKRRICFTILKAAGEDCSASDGRRSEIESGGITWRGYSKLHTHAHACMYT